MWKLRILLSNFSYKDLHFPKKRIFFVPSTENIRRENKRPNPFRKLKIDPTMNRLYTSRKGVNSFLQLQGERFSLVAKYYYWSLRIALGNRFHSPDINH